MTLEKEFYSHPIYQDFLRYVLYWHETEARHSGFEPHEWDPFVSARFDEVDIHSYFELPILANNQTSPWSKTNHD